MQSGNIAAPAAQKKTYVRPELIKHGKVESMTQIVPVQSGCSSPVKIPG
jgi:hypothetical protein